MAAATPTINSSNYNTTYSPDQGMHAQTAAAAGDDDNTGRYLEMIEVGGSRSLVVNSGARYQPLVAGEPTIDAVLFVYDEQAPKSASSLGLWYQECQAVGILQGCKSIALIGVQHRRRAHSSSPQQQQ